MVNFHWTKRGPCKRARVQFNRWRCMNFHQTKRHTIQACFSLPIISFGGEKLGGEAESPLELSFTSPLPSYLTSSNSFPKLMMAPFNRGHTGGGAVTACLKPCQVDSGYCHRKQNEYHSHLIPLYPEIPNRFQKVHKLRNQNLEFCSKVGELTQVSLKQIFNFELYFIWTISISRNMIMLS